MRNLTRFRSSLVKLALRFNLYMSRYKDYTYYLMRLVKVIARSKRFTVCLDLGCGDGYFSRVLARLCDFVVGLDINVSSSWFKKTMVNLQYIVADARKIPLRSSTVDVVIIISLLEHVPNWKVVITEAMRVLKPGGLVIIQIPNLHSSILEPHTHLPLLEFTPGVIKNAVTYITLHDHISWDCAPKNVLTSLTNNGFKILGILHYYSKLRTLTPQSYFIIAMKRK